MKLLKSFRFAFKGMGYALRTQRNMRWHMVATMLVVSGGIYYHITPAEWMACVLCFAMVIGAELFNTSIESIVDFISPEWHEKAGRIKDLSAAAVLLSAIASVVVAGFIFIPKIF